MIYYLNKSLSSLVITKEKIYVKITHQNYLNNFINHRINRF